MNRIVAETEVNAPSVLLTVISIEPGCLNLLNVPIMILESGDFLEKETMHIRGMFQRD